MGNPALTPHERFTYGQYITWPDAERWELIEGQAWGMTAAPSTSRKDQKEKLDLCAGHGVREYRVVDPAGEWICVYRLGKNSGFVQAFDEGELHEPDRDYSPTRSKVLEGLQIDPAELFKDLD